MFKTSSRLPIDEETSALLERYFEQGDFRGFSQLEMLQAFLYYVAGCPENKIIAKRLTDRYPSVWTAVHAPLDELIETVGGYPEAVRYLKAAFQLLDIYGPGSPDWGERLDCDSQIKLVTERFCKGSSRDFLVMYILDENRRILSAQRYDLNPENPFGEALASPNLPKSGEVILAVCPVISETPPEAYKKSAAEAESRAAKLGINIRGIYCFNGTGLSEYSCARLP